MTQDRQQETVGGTSVREVTQLLQAAASGQPEAADQLLDVVYGELRGLAGAIFRGRSPSHTLQPTALVHEAWMKVMPHFESLEGRRHFFAVAAKAMRQVLADHARAARRAKRGGGQATIELEPDQVAAPAAAALDVVDLDDALGKLATLHERHAAVVEMRLLGAMSVTEIAEHLGVSTRTIEHDWSMARAWLSRELAR